MGKLNLDDVKPGMTLAADVETQDGRLLLPKGTGLEEKHLQLFHTWGISELDIVGISRQDIAALAENEIDPARLDAARRHLLPLFKHVDTEDVFIGELFRLCSIRRVRKGT